ncbi:CAP domain-containing protein [Oscillospiraceae bacterium PP1C4]
MKKIALLLAMIMLTSGCSPDISSDKSTSQITTSLSEVSSSENNSAASEAAASLAAEKAASEAAAALAAEKAAAEAAAALAAQKAASEAAAALAAQKAASEAAAALAAEKAAAEAAASLAAEKAASEAAASLAAKKAAAQIAASESAVVEIKAVTGSNFLGKVESEIIELLNDERDAQGLDALTYDKNLRSAARIRSRELCKSDTFAHERPNGDDWFTVIQEDIPLKFHMAGENLCMTEYNDPNRDSATSASFWVNEWVNSPGHYENIIKPEFTHVGVGVYCIEENGMIRAYATTIFAKF